MPSEKDAAEPFLIQLDEHVQSKLEEVRGHNLNECRQLSSNILDKLF